MTTTKPIVNLGVPDWDLLTVLSRCQRAAKDAGWTQAQIDGLLEEMRSGECDYDHMLRTATKHFEVR
jgi:hypothetical protein